MKSTKDLNYYKNNCEEDYINTPISVLRYITELEQALQLQQTGVSGSALREKFFKETNIAPVFAQRTPYIQYIEFLEKELTR